MINGITVLNVGNVMLGNADSIWLIIVLIFFIAMVLIGTFLIDSKIGCIFFGLGVIGVISIIFISLIETDIKEYQVTIDDSVSMVDFTSKYDIIKVEGKIYTIREKECE